MSPRVEGRTVLGTPAGVRVQSRLDHEEIRIERQRDTTAIVIGAALAVGGLFLWLSGFVDGTRGVIPLGLLFVGVVIAAVTLGPIAIRALSRQSDEVIRLDGNGLEVGGRRVLWTNVSAVHRTAGRDGSGILVRDEGGALAIGGFLRPSVADWLQLRIEACWAGARDRDDEDVEARAQLESMLDRDA